MASRYCLQCGAPVADDDLFCGKCGAALTRATPPAPQANQFDPWAQSDPWAQPAPLEPSPSVPPPDVPSPASEEAATQVVLIAVLAALAVAVGAAAFIFAAAGN
jgi:hypothetical protein